MRRPLVAGNWKMHKTIAETIAFVRELRSLAPPLDVVDAVIFPPFTALAAAQSALGTDTTLGLGAQTMWHRDFGAFTGEISPLMVRECGARWVILGHSERRAHCCETDEVVNRKVFAALEHGLTPIVAVGESAEEHEDGATDARVVAQARAAFAGLDSVDVARCVLAYEPIWAIGTGKNCNPPDANAVMAAIRAAVPGLEATRLLYGGSVNPSNIGAFVAQPSIDGALVGGASLDPASFAALIENVRLEALR